MNAHLIISEIQVSDTSKVIHLFSKTVEVLDLVV